MTLTEWNELYRRTYAAYDHEDLPNEEVRETLGILLDTLIDIKPKTKWLTKLIPHFVMNKPANRGPFYYIVASSTYVLPARATSTTVLLLQDC